MFPKNNIFNLHRCIPLAEGDNLNLIHSGCSSYLPDNKCYLYNYRDDYEAFSSMLMLLNGTLETSSVPLNCREEIRAYVCNYVYPGCNPLTGQPEGICENDCITYAVEGKCERFFADIVEIATRTGIFKFEIDCNYTLRFLQTEFHQDFVYDPSTCWNISGMYGK